MKRQGLRHSVEFSQFETEGVVIYIYNSMVNHVSRKHGILERSAIVFVVVVVSLFCTPAKNKTDSDVTFLPKRLHVIIICEYIS